MAESRLDRSTLLADARAALKSLRVVGLLQPDDGAAWRAHLAALDGAVSKLCSSPASSRVGVAREAAPQGPVRADLTPPTAEEVERSERLTLQAFRPAGPPPEVGAPPLARTLPDGQDPCAILHFDMAILKSKSDGTDIDLSQLFTQLSSALDVLGE
jgi:hypothetical protein